MTERVSWGLFGFHRPSCVFLLCTKEVVRRIRKAITQTLVVVDD